MGKMCLLMKKFHTFFVFFIEKKKAKKQNVVRSPNKPSAVLNAEKPAMKTLSGFIFIMMEYGVVMAAIIDRIVCYESIVPATCRTTRATSCCTT